MTTDQAIGLAVCLAALISIPLAIRADARAQRAHEAWKAAFSEWLAGGMRGPRP